MSAIEGDVEDANRQVNILEARAEMFKDRDKKVADMVRHFRRKNAFKDIEIHTTNVKDSWDIGKLEEGIVYLRDAIHQRSINHKSDRYSIWCWEVLQNRYWGYCISAVSLLQMALVSYEFSDGPKSWLILLDSFAVLFHACNILVEFVIIHKTFWSIGNVGILLLYILSLILWSLRIYTKPFRALLRPVFFSIRSKIIQNTWRLIFHSVTSSADVLFAIVFVLFAFASLGYALYSQIDIMYFSTFYKSLVSMFVLMTSANFPDIMITSYADNVWNALFFTCFLVLILYLFVNILLAKLYSSFSHYSKLLVLERVNNVQLALKRSFELLCRVDVKQSPVTLDYNVWLYVHRQLDHHLVGGTSLWELLDKDGDGVIDYEDFLYISRYIGAQIDVEETPQAKNPMSNLKRSGAMRTFKNIKSWEFKLYPLRKLCYWLVQLSLDVKGTRLYLLDLSVDVVNLASVILFMTSLGSSFEGHVSVDILLVVSIVFFWIQMVLKVVAFGPSRYMENFVDVFDGVLTVVFTFSYSIFGMLGLSKVSLLFRLLRILLVVPILGRFEDIFSAMFFSSLNQYSFGVFIVLMLTFYNFAVVGMVLFRDSQSTLEATSDYVASGYSVYNFSTLSSSYIMLFILMVENNWNIFMEAGVLLHGEFARLYFIILYIFTVLIVLNIFLAFVIDVYENISTYKDENKSTFLPSSLASFLQRSESDSSPSRGNLFDEMFGGDAVKIRSLS